MGRRGVGEGGGKRGRGAEAGGRKWFQVRRGKNPRQGESLDKDKDKTDSTTKQSRSTRHTSSPADCGAPRFVKNIIFTSRM